MSWVILEGIDRSGKSTVAELYKEQGYEVVHFSAPDKKFLQPGYAGPSYADEILEMYMTYDAHDVIFDRSIYGELVWPHVYGRKPMIEEDDIEMLKEFEDRNAVQRILMIDPDKEGHWKRCVDNKEPLNVNQFKVADKIYEKLAHEHLFLPRQLSDFDGQKASDRKTSGPTEKAKADPKGPLKDINNDSKSNDRPVLEKIKEEAPKGRQGKLEKANAINQLLSKRIIRQKGDIFDSLEVDLRKYLDVKLGEIFGSTTDMKSFTEQEIQVLKIFCQRLNDKNKGEKHER